MITTIIMKLIQYPQKIFISMNYMTMAKKCLRVQIRSPNGSLQSAEPVMKRDDTAALIAPSKNDYLFPIREEIRTTDAHLSM